MRWRLLLFVGSALSGCGRGADAPTVVEDTPVPPRLAIAQLPTISINTSNALPVTSKEVYVTASFKLSDASGASISG